MPDKDSKEKPIVLSPTREKIHKIIFGADTFWGLTFDIALLVAILASIVVICLQTVARVNDVHENTLSILSWAFTILFTLEYFARLYCVRRPIRYITSFWGIIDLLSFLPDYVLLLLPGGGGREFGRAFSVIRSLRLLRVFRVFQLGWFQGEADELSSAIWRARGKIVVFLAAVMVIVTVAGTMMYEVEKQWAPLDELGNSTSQIHSIPEAIYWAIVTMTTVGFGDIVPKSVPGKFLSAIVILLGYSLIIVPTGFVSAEIIETKRRRRKVLTRSCPGCLKEGHDDDATYCKHCGEQL